MEFPWPYGTAALYLLVLRPPWHQGTPPDRTLRTPGEQPGLRSPDYTESSYGEENENSTKGGARLESECGVECFPHSD